MDRRLYIICVLLCTTVYCFVLVHATGLEQALGDASGVSGAWVLTGSTLSRRILYTLGRYDKLNFAMSDEERARLDSLGVGGVMAEFRKAGASNKPTPFRCVGHRTAAHFLLSPLLYGRTYVLLYC